MEGGVTEEAEDWRREGPCLLKFGIQLPPEQCWGEVWTRTEAGSAIPDVGEERFPLPLAQILCHVFSLDLFSPVKWALPTAHWHTGLQAGDLRQCEGIPASRYKGGVRVRIVPLLTL